MLKVFNIYPNWCYLPWPCNIRTGNAGELLKCRFMIKIISHAHFTNGLYIASQKRYKSQRKRCGNMHKSCCNLYRHIPVSWIIAFGIVAATVFAGSWYLGIRHIDGILPKGPYLPCLRMKDRALLAGYHRYCVLLVICCRFYCSTAWTVHFKSPDQYTSLL